MITIGEPPFLECSSKGAKHFSAFHARVNGKSIEEQYQAAKVFEDGSTNLHWRDAKGKRPVNADEVASLYLNLWRQYIHENPHLIPELVNATGLSDIFGQKGHQCQAISLWQIRSEILYGLDYA